jgi:hypothetical protein
MPPLSEAQCLVVYDQLRRAHIIIKNIATRESWPDELLSAVETVSGVLYLAESIFVTHPHYPPHENTVRGKALNKQERRTSNRLHSLLTDIERDLNQAKADLEVAVASVQRAKLALNKSELVIFEHQARDAHRYANESLKELAISLSGREWPYKFDPAVHG